MRFSTIFTVLAAGAMAFASAVPDVVGKRSVTQIEDVFKVLTGAIDIIIPEFGNCHDNTCTKDIVVKLSAAIDVCTSALGSLTGGLATPTLASLVANVVIKTCIGLNDHKNNCGINCPGAINIYAQVGVSLFLCLQKVFSLVIGLLPLVVALLLSLLAILKGLGFLSILQLLGL